MRRGPYRRLHFHQRASRDVRRDVAAGLNTLLHLGATVGADGGIHVLLRGGREAVCSASARGGWEVELRQRL